MIRRLLESVSFIVSRQGRLLAENKRLPVPKQWDRETLLRSKERWLYLASRDIWEETGRQTGNTGNTGVLAADEIC